MFVHTRDNVPSRPNLLMKDNEDLVTFVNRQNEKGWRTIRNGEQARLRVEDIITSDGKKVYKRASDE